MHGADRKPVRPNRYLLRTTKGSVAFSAAAVALLICTAERTKTADPATLAGPAYCFSTNWRCAGCRNTAHFSLG
jgi:hypothetical protein